VTTATIRAGGRTLEISRADKVLFPDAGLTKRDLAEYYRRVATHLLRHGADRYLSLHRFPDGIDGDGFYQKDVPDYFPDWIPRETVRKEDGELDQMWLTDAATLVYLADQACITPHVWLSRRDEPERPDRIIFDFDPPGDEFGPVLEAARSVDVLLDEVDATPFVMTTGSRGLHVVVPLRREAGFDEVRDTSRRLAELAVSRSPELLTLAQRKNRRGEKVFVDTLRNARAQTAVAPYAVRARPGAPVATPLSRDELGRSDIQPRKWTIENLFRRLGSKDDPWKGMGRHRVSPSLLRERIDRLQEAEASEEGSERDT
jgi:bifunctional non-homologous end joining protein LigD